MKIAFDPARDASNRLKHGVSLELGRWVVAEARATLRDERFDCGERRYVAFGYVTERLYACVYTVRDEATRIISVRKANAREVAKYG